MNGKKITTAIITGIALFALVTPANAQSIGIDGVNAKLAIGDIDTFAELVQFMINWTIYIGWVAAVFGVGGAIAAIIYKSLGSDSDETVKNFQGYMTKAVLIIVAGILLACFGYLLKVIVAFIPGLNLTSEDTLDVASTDNPFGEGGATEEEE